MFGLSLSSDVIKYGAIALAFVIYTVWQREQAATKAREECRSAVLAQTVSETRRQIVAGNQVIAGAEKRLAAEDIATALRIKEMESINASAKKLTGDKRCAVPDAITKRLSAIK